MDDFVIFFSISYSWVEEVALELGLFGKGADTLLFMSTLIRSCPHANIPLCRFQLCADSEKSYKLRFPRERLICTMDSRHTCSVPWNHAEFWSHFLSTALENDALRPLNSYLTVYHCFGGQSSSNI